MSNDLYMLIDTVTGLRLNGPRQFQSPDDEHIRADVSVGTAWVLIQTGEEKFARKGETVEPDEIAKPMPYVEGTTVYFDGWKITGTYQPPSLDSVKTKAKTQVTAWKESRQDEDFTHSDTLQYGNSQRDRINLSGAVNLAILKKMTAPPGPRVPAVAVRMPARDGTVTTMDEDALAALGLSALAHMQGFGDTAIQAHADIGAAADEAAVQAVLDALQ